MSITGAQRQELHQEIETVFSPTSAATLMELLPPVGFADLATKDDLAHLATELRSEMAVGFSQVDARFAQVDARFAQVDVRFAQVDARFAELNATLAGVETRILRDQRVFTFTLISSLTGLAAIALTIMGLS
ncbi:MAG: hypothetical protein WBF71_13350 [Microthrixaceae bacterium]